MLGSLSLPRRLALGTCAALLLLTCDARAHGTDNVVMGSTTDGGGSLVASYDYATHILVTPSTTIAGFTIHTSSSPGLTPLLADDLVGAFFVLNDGTTLSFTLAAPLDAGVSVKIGSTVLDAVGETALVGTFQVANADAFHVHPTWTLTVPAGTATTRQVSFKLTAPGYGESPVYTALLSNIAPTPTATPTLTPTATVTPTLTPIATVSATATGGAEATTTPTPTVLATATGDGAPSSTPTPNGPPHLDDASTAKSAVKCAGAIRTAADKHARATLAGLAKCAHAVLRCVQLDAGDAGCLAKAGGTCAKTGAKIGDDESKLAGAVEKKCAALGLAAVRAAAGLGFETALAECSGYGVTLDDLASVGRCVARQHACRTASLLGVETPRAGEALRLVGQSFVPAVCLADRGGTGAGAGDPKGVGKSLLKCNAAAADGGAKILQARLARADKCLGALFACVQTRPDDVACLDDAAHTCAAGDAKVAAAEDKLAGGLAKQCAPVPLVSLAADDGAGLAALAGDCASYGVTTLGTVDDYGECLRRQHACRAADLVGLASPRAEELLGLVGESLFGAFCPAAP